MVAVETPSLEYKTNSSYVKASVTDRELLIGRDVIIKKVQFGLK